MRIGELSRRSGVSVPTIKFYLREELLPPGTSSGAANQAEYGEEHLHRLHLVRTLTQVGGLSVAAVRETLAALDNSRLSRHRLLAVAHNALPGRVPGSEGDDVRTARADVDRYLAQLGWNVAAASAPRSMLADALVALRRLGRDVGPEVFTPYAQVAEQIARREIATLDPDAPRAELLEEMVVGTVVFEAALVALRRLAQANESARRLGRR